MCHPSSTAPETAFAALHWQDFVLALRTSSNLYVVETCNTKIIKSAIARIFLSGLYLPAVPSSTLRRVSRAVMALIPHAYPPCHDFQCVFPCVLFSFTRCLNSCRGNRKPGSEEGAFSHPQRNVDLSTSIPSTYACSRLYSRPLCYAYSLCSFKADFSCSI